VSYYAESPFEAAALQYFVDIGYEIAHGPEVGPEGGAPERASYGEVLLLSRLRSAIDRLNSGLSDEAADAAITALQRFDSANVAKEAARRYFLIRDGVPVEVETGLGERRTIRVQIADLVAGGERNNDFLVVNQLRVVEPTGSAGRTSSSISTASRSRSSSSRALTIPTPRSEAPSTSSRLTSPRSRRSWPGHRSWSLPMAP
jgi:type I site-specific restriction-modification system R (restriction) subunit